MDGVFLRDFLVDLPLTHWRDYGLEYLARFPALGFAWYLPFFALVEALFFLIGGVGVAAAKLCMLSWFVLLALLAYRWGRGLVGPGAALAATLIVLANPHLLLWARSVMLDVPALVMLLLFLVGARWYAAAPSGRRSALVGAAGFCALMTKQTTLFMLPVAALVVLQAGGVRALVSVRAVPALLLVGLGLAATAAHSVLIGHSGLGIVLDTVGNPYAVWLHERLPLAIAGALDFFGWPLWLAALLGSAIGAWAGRGATVGLLWAWIGLELGFVAILSPVAGDLHRYAIYIAPPVGLLAAQLLDGPWPERGLRLALGLLFAAAAAPTAAAGLRAEHPWIEGYQAVVQSVAALTPPRPVLFCCLHEGNYVFHARRLDPERRSVTLRADKMLVSIVIAPERGMIVHADTPEAILALLDANAVGYLVIEEGTMRQVAAFDVLRRLVRSDRFETLGRFPIRSFPARPVPIEVSLYRYRDASPPAEREIRIPVPQLGLTLTLRP